MNISEIEKLIYEDLKREPTFENWHGITHDNLKDFLITPYQAMVDLDDGTDASMRSVWVVLHERKKPEEGYVVVYDPVEKDWGVALHVKDNEFFLVIGADTIVDALEGM